MIFFLFFFSKIQMERVQVQNKQQTGMVVPWPTKTVTIQIRVLTKTNHQNILQVKTCFLKFIYPEKVYKNWWNLKMLFELALFHKKFWGADQPTPTLNQSIKNCQFLIAWFRVGVGWLICPQNCFMKKC